MGRPSGFTEDIASTICSRLANGESLRKICADDSMPSTSTVCKWLSERREFSEQYARAREVQADVLADEILEIADDGSSDTYIDSDGKERTDQEVVARSRLRVDARKWYASKLAPKKYGDKIAVGGADDLPPVQHNHVVVPNLTAEQWMEAHGLGTAARPPK